MRNAIQLRDAFLDTIASDHTRRSYESRLNDFLTYCAAARVSSIRKVDTPLVLGWVESKMQTNRRPSLRVTLAAIRSFFDWLVIQGKLRANPVPSTRALPPELYELMRR